MKQRDLKQRTEEDLKKLVQTLKARQVELRFNVLSGNIKDIAESQSNRKTIARALTLLTQRSRENQ